MNIDTYYKQFWTEAQQQFKQGKFEFDPLIDDPNDTRFGISVLLRPSDVVKQSIGNMLAEFNNAEPDQYYYPLPDIHVTILSVVSCYAGFTMQSFQQEHYCNIIRQSLHNISPFKIHFQGITASSSCIMIQGYPDGELNLFRNNLRHYFRNSGLQVSFDVRYTSKVAHSTVMRFKSKLKSPKRLIKQLGAYRRFEFGTTHVTEVEFVFNDWYQRTEKGKCLAKFGLDQQNEV